MTHDQLLAKVSNYKDAGLGSLVALRAVVELHKPCDPVSDDKFVTCETCNYEYAREYPWPCETIQAIEKELG
jgi:hypothetical protein